MVEAAGIEPASSVVEDGFYARSRFFGISRSAHRKGRSASRQPVDLAARRRPATRDQPASDDALSPTHGRADGTGRF